MVENSCGIRPKDWDFKSGLGGSIVQHWVGLLDLVHQSQQQQQQEIKLLRDQLTALATELASQRDQIGLSSRNSSIPSSSDGPVQRYAETPTGYKPPERRKGSCPQAGRATGLCRIWPGAVGCLQQLLSRAKAAQPPLPAMYSGVIRNISQDWL